MARIVSPTRGAFLRERLSDSSHTQQALADYLDVSIGRVHKILRGDDMLISEALNVCRFLHLSPEALWVNAPELHPVDTDVVQGLNLASHIMALPKEARDPLNAFLDALWVVEPSDKQRVHRLDVMRPPVRPVG